MSNKIFTKDGKDYKIIKINSLDNDKVEIHLKNLNNESYETYTEDRQNGEFYCHIKKTNPEYLV